MIDQHHEDLLRHALRDEAASLNPKGGWADVVRRSGRVRQRRNAFRFVGAAAAAGVAVAVALPLLGGDGSEETELRTDPSTSATAPTTEPRVAPPTTVAAQRAILPDGEPLPLDQMVAVVARPGVELGLQEVMVVSAVDGAERRRLFATDTVEGGVLDITLTPDRRTVLLSVATTACNSQVFALAADGTGEPMDLGPGERIAISPSGAFLAVTLNDDCDAASAIEVRAVDPQVSVAHRFGDEGGLAIDGLPSSDEYPALVHGLAFVDDGTLAYEVRYEDGDALYQLDLASGSDERFGPTGATNWRRPASRAAEGQLLVVETCCDDFAPSEWRAIVVDVDGNVVQVLGDLGAAKVRDLLSPGTGEVAWVDEDGRLFVLGQGGPVELATEITSAAW